MKGRLFVFGYVLPEPLTVPSSLLTSSLAEKVLRQRP